MNAKTLSLAALAALIALVAMWASNLGVAPERSSATPSTEPRAEPRTDPLQELSEAPHRESAGDLAPGPAPTPLTEPPASTPTVAENPALTGKVVDALGAPVGGAEIWVHSTLRSTPIPWPWAQRARLETTTDPSGAFATDAAPGESLEARAPGHSPSRVERAPGTRAPIVLTLRGQGAKLEGAVRAGGTAVAGATLDLRRPRTLVSSGERASRRFQSGAEGEFALDDLAPGSATLMASAPGFEPRTVPVELRAGERLDVLLELDPGASLSGLVVTRDQVPIAGVEVLAPDHEPPAIARTDERGSFACTGLAPGPLRVVARHAKYEGAERLLVLAPGENAPCTIVLEPLARLAGRVIDQFGTAVAGVTVDARAVDPGPGQPVAARSVSDADGRFEIQVPGGSEHAFVLREPGQWLAIDAAWLGTFVAPRATIVLTLRLEDRASAFVLGRVVDEGGGPLAGARFQIGDGVSLGTVGLNTPGTTASDEAGRFRLGPLPAREFVLVVHPEDPGLPSFRSETFALAPSEVRDLGDLAVPERATLVASAVFEDGQPVAKALMQLEARGGEVQILEFGEGGRIVRGLLPGTYEATVYGSGFLTLDRSLDLVAGEDVLLELVLRRAARCPVDVTLPEGETAGRLRLADADGAVEFDTELEQGDPVRILWPALTMGAHRAELICAGGNRYTAHFDAEPPDGGEAPVILLWRRVE